MRTGIVLMLGIGAAACGGDGGGTGLEGVYTINSWVLSAPDCEVAGTSVIEVRGHLTAFVKMQHFLGEDIFTFIQCPSVAECAAQANEADTLHIGNYNFESGNDKDGWTGRRNQTSGTPGASCEGPVVTFVMTGTPASTISIREETVLVSDIPRDSEGDCDDDDAFAAAQAGTCSEREVLEAAFVQAL